MPLSRALLHEDDASTLANPKCRQSLSMERIEAQHEIERAWEDVKHVIFARDKGRCRLCGLKCWYGAA